MLREKHKGSSKEKCNATSLSFQSVLSRTQKGKWNLLPGQKGSNE